LANNRLASACDSRRPTISFGTSPLAIKLVALGELAIIQSNNAARRRAVNVIRPH